MLKHAIPSWELNYALFRLPLYTRLVSIVEDNFSSHIYTLIPTLPLVGIDVGGATGTAGILLAVTRVVRGISSGMTYIIAM